MARFKYVFFLFIVSTGVSFAVECTVLENSRNPMWRMAAFHETIVWLDEAAPNAAVVTYHGGVIQSDWVTKISTFVADKDQLIGADKATDIVIEDFPGGIEGHYMLAGAKVTAQIIPLIEGRQTEAKDGLALYRVSTDPAMKIIIRCGGGLFCPNHFLFPAQLRSMDNIVNPANKLNLSGGIAFFKDPNMPFMMGISSPSNSIKTVETEEGPYMEIIAESGKADVLIAYSSDQSRVKELIDTDSDKALKNVDMYYSELLKSKIQTPEPALDEAFRSAIYNLEYNYLKPYGWIECIYHWHSIWHQQHTRGAEWLGQEQRSRDCIIEQAKKIFDTNQIPNLTADGTGFESFGGTNQFYTWEARHYFKFTNDRNFVKEITSVLDRVLEGTLSREDPDGDFLLGWGQQIGNQEDFIATPHNGTVPTIEGINMMKTRAEFAKALGGYATADLWQKKVDLAHTRLKESLWMKDLGRFAYFTDPKGVTRPDGAYQALLYPAIWDIVDPLDQYTGMRHLMDRLQGTNGEVYGSNHFPYHDTGSWGMQAGCTQQPWAAWGFSKAGFYNQAYRPLKATALWVMSKNQRGSWPEVGAEGVPAYFTPPAGLYIAAMVEAIFGLKPDMPNGTLEISPAFPDHWPQAKLQLPKFQTSYQRKGNKLNYIIKTKDSFKPIVRWKLPPAEIVTFTINGGNIQYDVESKVGFIELTAAPAVSDIVEIELEYKPYEFKLEYPRTIAEGQPFELCSTGLKINKVDDRCGVLANWDVDGNTKINATIQNKLLAPYATYGNLGLLNFSRRTFFVNCAINDSNVWLPVDITILPEYEANAENTRVTDNGFTVDLLVRNNTENTLAGNAVLFLGNGQSPFSVSLEPRSEAVYTIEIADKQAQTLSPSDNKASVLLPSGVSIDFVIIIDKLPGIPMKAPGRGAVDRFEAIELPVAQMIEDTEWTTLRFMQGQPHIFVFWPEWNQPLKSLAGKHELKIPEIDGLTFKINERKILPVSPGIDKPVFRVPLKSEKYKKFYMLVLPLVDSHDMFTPVASFRVYHKDRCVYERTIYYPGDVDYLDPHQAGIGGSVRDRKGRGGLLPMLGAQDQDWNQGKAPAFPQPQFWSRSVPVLLESGTLTVLEFDLEQMRPANSILLESIGEYAALGILGIIAEKTADPDSRLIFVFDHPGDLKGWQFEGDAFSVAPVPQLFSDPTLNSLAKAGETATGKAVSPEFPIEADDKTLVLEFHGGTADTVHGKANLSIALVDSKTGKTLSKIQPVSTHQLMKKNIDVSQFQGEKIRLVVSDDKKEKTYAWIGLKSVRIKK